MRREEQGESGKDHGQEEGGSTAAKGETTSLMHNDLPRSWGCCPAVVVDSVPGQALRKATFYHSNWHAATKVYREMLLGRPFLGVDSPGARFGEADRSSAFATRFRYSNSGSRCQYLIPFVF